jgi:hypothetical protein
MPESKLKQSITKTLMGGTTDKVESDIKEVKVENVAAAIEGKGDEFEQASKTDSSKVTLDTKADSSKPQLDTKAENNKPGERKEVSATDTAAKKATDKKPIDNTVANRKIEKAPSSKKPVKSPAIKNKPKKNYMGGSTLALSILAVLVAGYSMVEQKQSQAVMTETLDMVTTDMGDLNLKSDELKVDLIKVQDKVQLNTNNIAKFETIQDYIADLDKQINDKLEEIEIIKGRMDRHDKTLEQHGDELKKLGIKIKKYTARRAPAKKAVKRVAAKKAYDDPTKLKDAVVASIDTWGTQPSVMLRNDRGNWIPMSMGDYYKGWKLSGVMGDEAIFKKGKKLRRLTIEG